MTTEEEVLLHIPEEHRDRFSRSIQKANRDFREVPDYARGVFSSFKSIRAGCMWALMVRAAQAEFAGTEVVVAEKHNTVTFSFRGHVLVQMKKANRWGRASWGKTRRAEAFRLQVPMPGEPEKHRVYVAYILDRDGIRLERVVLAQRGEGLKAKWMHPFTEPEQLPFAAIGAEELAQQSRVKPNPETERQRFRSIDNAEKRKDAAEGA